MGVSNSKALLLVAISLAMVGEDLVKGGKFNVAALSEVFPLLPQLAAIPSQASLAISELKDLQPDEVKELVEAVVAKLGIADAHALDVIDKGLKAAIANYDLYLSIKGPVAA